MERATVEQEILGQFIVSPKLFPSGIKAEYFDNPLHQDIFEAMTTSHKNGLDISDIKIIKENDKSKEKTVALSYLFDLKNSIMTTNNFNTYKAKLFEFFIEAEKKKIPELSIENMKNRLAELENLQNELIEITEILPSYFEPITPANILEILDLTIKEDTDSKLATFLCMVTAFSEESQFNILFQAPSSTGKSHIGMEIIKLFPKSAVMILGHTSKQAFFHDGNQNENGELLKDLSRKIILFVDQPSTQLLETIRPMLSHDQKIIICKITDKNKKGSNRTKTIKLIGYPAVIFCSADSLINEQESTRFLLLSPETTIKKLEASVKERIHRESNPDLYNSILESNSKRKSLRQRLKAIQKENIQNIIIKNSNLVEKMFLETVNGLKPRHSRDVSRLNSFIKAFAILNFWHREKDDFNNVFANENDIKNGLALWANLFESQEIGLSPYIHNIYKDVLRPLAEENLNNNLELGIKREQIFDKHRKIYGRNLSEWTLRKQILPSLENAGLITIEPDPNHKQKKLVYITQELDKTTVCTEGGTEKEDQRIKSLLKIFSGETIPPPPHTEETVCPF